MERILAVLAGIFFGVWPLLLKKSGLKGDVSSAAFNAITLAILMPVALWRNGFSLPQANWTLVVYAGISGALGLLCFNNSLAIAPEKDVGTMFVLMTVVQVAVAASYQLHVTGQMQLDRFFGYVAAAVAAYLLLR